jgi:integrase
MRLTDAAIRSLKPREKVYDVYDDDVKCFGIRVTPGGVKSFTFFYRLGDRRKKKRINLGEYPSVTLADARSRARDARGVVKGQRRHPQFNAPPASQSTDDLTIEGLSELYLASDKFRGGREATRVQFSRIIAGEITPALGPRPLATIAPADLVDWAQGIIDRGAPVTANQSFKILRLVWNWGRRRLVRHGVPPFPLAGFGKPWDGELPRKRHLSPDVIRRFVEAVDEEPRLTAVWWLLMLFNLTRKTETCLLEKNEIIWRSERGPYLIVPAWKAKNHQALYQPLTSYSELLLRLAIEHSAESKWVMPGRQRAGHAVASSDDRGKDGPRFQRTGVPASRVSRRIGTTISPHDLRHTIATMMGELGVEPHIIDALQNHKLPQSTSVTGTYNDALVWAYFKQKREALELWHEHLDKKILKGRLVDHIRQAVDGQKQFEDAMKLNMKLGPHSDAHKVGVRRRSAASPRERRSA